MPILVLCLLLALLGCATHVEPPVLPEEPVMLDDLFPPLPASPEQADLVELPAQQCDYARTKTLRRTKRAPQVLATVAPPAERPLLPAPPPVRAKRVTPEQVVAQGLKEAEVSPTLDCFAGKGAICRFAFEPGKIYTIPTHPSAASRLYFPPGDRVVTHPLIHLCADQGQETGQEKGQCWEKISGQMGPEGWSQDVIAFRPVTVDTPAVVTGVDLESGRSIYFRLVVGKTPMLGVAWDMPPIRTEAPPQVRFASQSLAPEAPAVGCAGTGMRMPIELAQLHTAYRIEPKGSVGFLPTQVFDDGRKTLIKFRQLGGNVPTVFVYKPNGERGLVYFTPYRVPGDPSHGVYYVIDNIWHRIELAGTDGQSVMITRLSDVPAVASADRPRS